MKVPSARLMTEDGSLTICSCWQLCQAAIPYVGCQLTLLRAGSKVQRRMLCLQFPLAGWLGHELLWGSLLCRLPGTARWNALLPAGTNCYLQLRPLQEHHAECL